LKVIDINAILSKGSNGANIVVVSKEMQSLIDMVVESGHYVVLEGRKRKRVALVPVLDEEFLEQIEDQIDLRLVKKRKKERGGIEIEELFRKYAMRKK